MAFSVQRFRLAASALACVLPPSFARALPDTFQGRLESLAAMETLNAELLAGRSATRTLEHWCATHAMASEPKLRAERVRGDDKAPDAAQRARLGVGPDEPVKYRHVRLACGDRVLSDADNWYVPARLTPEMNRLLETTETPFGKAVAALTPTRETFAVAVLWHPLPDGWEIAPPPPEHPGVALDVPPVLFEHRAILYDAQHRPFSEVDERYTKAILDFGAKR